MEIQQFDKTNFSEFQFFLAVCRLENKFDGREAPDLKKKKILPEN